MKVDLLNMEILIKKEDIANHLDVLAKQINLKYKNLDDIHILWLAEGALFFVADLLRKLDFNFELSSLKVSSYFNNKKADLNPTINGNLAELKGKNVLILDDIFDTGLTMQKIYDELNSIGAKTINIACLLNKKVPKQCKLKLDFPAIEIQDYYVFGYGLDFNSKYRHLEDIYFKE